MGYEVGFAEREITPNNRIELVGYGSRIGGLLCDNILDPLYVKVLVIDDGKNQSVILAFDSLGFDYLAVKEIKMKISKETDLELKDILIVATHTHSAPSSSTFVIEEWKKHEEYYQHLLSQTLIAVKEAFGKKGKAKFSFRSTNCNWNHYRMGGNREVEVDNSISVIRMDLQNETIILFSYACHPVILNTSSISSDFVGFARKVIEQNSMLKNKTYSIFLNGCCGNVNPYHPELKIDLSEQNAGLVVKLGTELGNAVNDVILHMIPLEETPIVNKLLLVAGLEKNISGQKTEAEAQVQLVEFASLRLIGISGEPFIETGNWIKKTYGDKCIPLGYANENIGYIPLKEYFDDPSVRKYEVYGASQTVYGIDISKDLEELIRDKVTELLN